MKWIDDALKGRQKLLRANIFRPCRGSFNTTSYPGGLRPRLNSVGPTGAASSPYTKFCNSLRGRFKSLYQVLQQPQCFAPTVPPLVGHPVYGAGFLARLASGAFLSNLIMSFSASC